ncbi:MAG: C45 family autoproteolytic acyltransferase/hydrolase [Planctomycetota bacterium]
MTDDRSRWADAPVIALDADPRSVAWLDRVPDELWQMSRELVREVLADIPAQVEQYMGYLEGRFAPVMHEMNAVAARLGERWSRVALANVSYDLMVGRFGCSTMALATADGPVLARNMDWAPERALARASVQLERPDGMKIAGWLGLSGVVSGMSPFGFAVAINAVGCSEPTRMDGIPVLLFMRGLLEECRGGFDEALVRLQKTPLASPALITIVGKENHQRAVVERMPSRAALRVPAADGEPLITTNHYVSELDAPTGGNELADTACHRMELLGEITSRAADDFGGGGKTAATDHTLLDALTHDGIRMGITAQQMVMRPRSGTMRLVVPSEYV